MDSLMDTDDVAGYLGISPQTARTWRHERRGPMWLKVGRRVRYRRDDVELWLRTRECDTEASADLAGAS